MKIIKFLIVASLVITSISARAADISKIFTPTTGIKAQVAIEGENLTWKVYGKNWIKHGSVKLDLDIDTTPYVTVESYDFSGRLGFSVSHLDEGKGTYYVYRIFTFSSIKNDFIERNPSCGDGFIDLRVDKKRHFLISTYYDQNIPKFCLTRLPIIK